MRLRRPRLWALLLAGNLAVLSLPLAGLWGLRLYESALVRQTESELVAQAAVLAGVLRARLGGEAAGGAVPGSAGPAAPGEAALLLARRAGLDLANDPVLPAVPEPGAGGVADARMAAAGRELEPVLRDVQAVTLASLRVIDRGGTIVASTGSDRGMSLAAWPEAAAALGGAPLAAGMHAREAAKAVPGGISRTAGLRVFVALPVAVGGDVVGAVVLSRTPNTLGSALWGKRWALAGLGAALLAGGAGVAWGLSRLVTRPLGRVVAQAEAVAGGGRMVALERPGTREVAALSAALARMAAVLERRAGLISGFAGSVSHEFKAPLAAIRASAELLEEEGLAGAERAQLAGLLVEGVARLDQLVGRLVELARADVMAAGPARGERADVGAVMGRVAARFRDEGVEVVAEGGGMAAIGEAALEAALAGLVENAVRHAPGSAVRLEGAVREGRCRVVVADEGPGIAPGDRERVFEPFYSTARERGGTGLGLPIVRALLGASGGTVRVGESARGAALVVEVAAG